jgi:hypothetical protein
MSDPKPTPAPEYIYAHGKRYVTVEHMADQMLIAYETGKRAALVATTPERVG